MNYTSLRDFIKYLDKHDLLIKVKCEVSTVLEMTEIQNRLLQTQGKAILFENVITENGKSNIPVLVNLFGTIERVAMGMDIKPHNAKQSDALEATEYIKRNCVKSAKP